ncbi:MAG: hypothetical protein WAV31_02885 [Candidatus Moraniibacteriota bacterium]
MKSKKEKDTSGLAIACIHLLNIKKPTKIYEIVMNEESTFMCPQCYKTNKMQKDIDAGLIDDWTTICLNCIHKEFKNIKQIII